MDRSERPSPHHPVTQSPPSPVIPSVFLAFRLVYIPASVLAHSGHGLPWLTALMGLAATFGLETLVRRGQPENTAGARSREMAVLLIALVIIGLFPEEAPIAVILWAVTGALWPRITPTLGGISWAGLLAGTLLGLTGLFGPGSWLMAGLLLIWRQRRGESAHAAN